MALFQFDDNSTLHPDDNVVVTPPETVAADVLIDDPLDGIKYSSSSVPWPGSTFIIRSMTSGHLVTLLDGQVVLAPPGGRGSIHWACVDTKGWLGFQNIASGRFLGYNSKGKLCCLANRQQEWENFCVRMRPDGGYVLLMTHYERLWQVGMNMQQGAEMLVKIGSDGVAWEFVKV